MSHQTERDTQINTYKGQDNSIDQFYEKHFILNASNTSKPDSDFKLEFDEGESQIQHDEEENSNNSIRQTKIVQPARVKGDNSKIGTYGVGVLDLVSSLLPYIMLLSVERSYMHTYLPDILSIILAMCTVVASHHNNSKYGIYYLVVYRWIRYVRLVISCIVVGVFSYLLVSSI